MVAYMDKLVGKIVTTLDDLGIRENTIIFFTGDNGTDKNITSMLGDVAIKGGKSTMTNAGTHVPLIVNWKNSVSPGRISDDLIDFSDFLPTIAELSGTALPPGVLVDGQSFAQLLSGQAHQSREWVFIQLGDKYFIRNQRWRLHQNEKLFDMVNDPFEENPIYPGADNEESAEARTFLEKSLQSFYPPLTTEPAQEMHGVLIKEFNLIENFPNPFNSETTIRYQTPKSARIKITVTDTLGKIIKNLVDKIHSQGQYGIRWNGRNQSGKTVNTGLYFITMRAENFKKTVKVFFIK